MEEKSYLKELGGREKKKESFKQIFKARRFLKRRYGKIYIQFSQPISIKEYLLQNKDLEEDNNRQLAFHLIKSINKVTIITPLALIASAILTKHRRGFHVNELTDTADILLRFLRTYKVPTATTLNHFERTVGETLTLLVNRKVVNLLEDVDGEETFYYVDEDKKRELEYYKNSIIHCFIPHAFVAVSLLTGTEETRDEKAIMDDYAFLKRLFKNEFVYDDGKDANEGGNNAIDYFLDSAFIIRGQANGEYKLTRLGFDKLPIWAALAKTFLESYWIATQSFIQRENKSRKKGDLLKNMNYLGLRFHKIGMIDHLEAVSRINFSNAISFINEEILQSQEVTEGNTPENKEKLSELSQKLYGLSHYRA
jgi:glycerol-3-phosphate O-acyltransferase